MTPSPSARATWRCPHCGTLQPDAPLCWACQRSPMSCRTCRYFRRSVAGGMGFCALDRTRAAISGEETRPCWAGEPAAIAALPPSLLPMVPPVGDEDLAEIERSGSAVLLPERRTAERRDQEFPDPRLGRLIDAPPVAPAGRHSAAGTARGREERSSS